MFTGTRIQEFNRRVALGSLAQYRWSLNCKYTYDLSLICKHISACFKHESKTWQPWTEMHFCPAYLCQVPLLDNITRKSLCTAASAHSFFRDLCLHSARAFTFMHITLFHLWDGSIVLMCLFCFVFFFSFVTFNQIQIN